MSDEKTKASDSPVDLLLGRSWDGCRLKRCRTFAGVTQAEMCKEIGITQPTLAKIEADPGEIRQDRAEKLQVWWTRISRGMIETLYKDIEFIRAL